MTLVVDKLNKSFGDNHVLRDLSFTAQSGVALGLLGRNGSGKTTTIRTMLNIFPADSGSATIDGTPVRDMRERIGYLPEERGLYPKRIIRDQMAYIGSLRGLSSSAAKKRAEELLVRIEAEEYLDRRLDTLSKGNQQKIQLAIALMTNPDIVILDEPFSGLDPVNAQMLKRLVTELVGEGKMVIFSSHQMAVVEEFCDDICIINGGEVALAGNLRRIKRTYPRYQVLITPELSVEDQLCRKLSESSAIHALAAEIKPYGRYGSLVRLHKEDDKGALFRALTESNIPIDAITVLEPTLEDIFVEKVGAEA